MEGKVENITEKNKEDVQSELASAIFQYSENNFQIPLDRFIKKYGVQEIPLEITSSTERNSHSIVNDGLWWIETRLDYEDAMKRWKILKDAGALGPEILGKYIEEYINDTMSINRVGRPKIDDPEFLNEFTKDLKSRIKDSLGWDIVINLKQK